MTTYSKDFLDEGTTGIFASDFTSRYASTSDWTIEAEADAEDNRVFETDGSGSGRQGVSWDDIDGDANRDDIELVVRFRVDQDDDAIWELFARGSGSDGSENHYLLSVSNGGFVTIYRVVAGVASILASFDADGPNTSPWWFHTGGDVGPSFSITPPNEWLYARFRINGTGATVNLKARIWGDGQEEGADWNLDFNDTNAARITAVGWCGFGRSQHGNELTQYDYLGVGTNGDTAPIVINTGTVNRLTGTYAQVISSVDDPVVRLTGVQAAVVTSIDDPGVRLTGVQVAVVTSIDAPDVRLTGSYVQVVYRSGAAIANVFPVSVITN